MKNIIAAVLFLMTVSAIGYAQPRQVDQSSTAPANLPSAFKARYEGGIFGSSGKEKGELKFDDANQRVVFHRQDGTEMFHVPYTALILAYPDSRTSMTQTGNVLSRAPLPGAGLFGLMSKDHKFLILRYDDEDINAEGTVNFRFDEKQKLLQFVHALGYKAKLKQKGDAYYRPKRAI